MKNKTFFLTIALVLIMTFSCKKDSTPEAKTIKSYSLTNIKNAYVQNTKCGIDLGHGKLYSVIEGQSFQDSIDIAYGYMTSSSRYERVFLSTSYAGCRCGGSSYFSYGDVNIPATGYSSYSVRNETKLYVATSSVNFDSIAKAGTKSALDRYFPTDSYSTDEVFLASQDILITNPYIFFETVKGKRGIIRVKPFVRNVNTDYQYGENPVGIDVLVEK